MEGDSLGAAFFFDLVMARVQAALSRAAEVSASPADGTEDCRLLAIARWIAAEQGGRPEPSSAYELEFRCPVREGWPVTVWLTLLRRDQMAGGMRGYAPGPRRLFP